MNKILFNSNKLDEFISSHDYSGASRLLLKEQLKNWQELKGNYNSLKNVQIKSFQYEGFVIKVQHNPGRVKSSAAKVDEKSIKKRKCFLCPENLYREQRALQYEDFLILVNPFPILPEHFTIPHKDHIPQTIKKWFGKMLLLSKDLQRDVIIYNGPKCGASAPDHLHFQAGTKFFMPLDNEFHSLKNEYGELLVENDSLIVSGIDDGLRRFISIESPVMSLAEKVFNSLYKFYSKVSEEETEPMMNILSLYEPADPEGEGNYGWRVLIFLREKHRPSFFYSEGEDNILWSPAAVDLGGMCITPLEKDFSKITKEKLTEGFNEITISKEKFSFIKSKLKDVLFREKI